MTCIKVENVSEIIDISQNDSKTFAVSLTNKDINGTLIILKKNNIH